jgi:hypothetical protein
MALRPWHGLALCVGAGGLELGLRLALGDALRCVGYVERDSFAAAILVLWPTPDAMVAQNGEEPESWLARRETLWPTAWGATSSASS